MVVIETTLQIAEMDVDGHAMAVVQHSHTASLFHNGECSSSFVVRLSYTFSESKKGSIGSFSFLHRLRIYPWECSTLLVNGLPVTTFIHEGYRRLEPFLYPCTIEFSLMCLTVSSPCF
jgi:hypothetical protein